MIQQTVQFGGLSQEDPNVHIANFLEICDTYKHNGVTDDAIRLISQLKVSLKIIVQHLLNKIFNLNLRTYVEC